MSVLQDRCPPSPMQDIDAMLLKDTGKSRELYFSDWDPNPIGTASIAQVHLATDRQTGQRVAVKLQHPDLEEWFSVECVPSSDIVTDGLPANLTTAFLQPRHRKLCRPPRRVARALIRVRLAREGDGRVAAARDGLPCVAVVGPGGQRSSAEGLLLLFYILAGVEATNAARTIHDFEHMRHTSLYVPEVKWVEKRILVMECASTPAGQWEAIRR
jgi:hypothetical protein